MSDPASLKRFTVSLDTQDYEALCAQRVLEDDED